MLNKILLCFSRRQTLVIEHSARAVLNCIALRRHTRDILIRTLKNQYRITIGYNRNTSR
jgi:gluconate kinase